VTTSTAREPDGKVCTERAILGTVAWATSLLPTRTKEFGVLKPEVVLSRTRGRRLMATRVAGILNGVIHRTVFVGVLAVIVAPMVSTVDDSTPSSRATDDPDHERNCLVCQTAFRDARSQTYK
jgi:hypothetical protein